jgi:hypothetical protein
MLWLLQSLHAAPAGVTLSKGRVSVLAAILATALGAPVLAVTSNLEAEDLAGRGVPMEQQFLPSGASVVTTAAGRSCVVSRRIEIEASRYLDSDGKVLPFGQIIRSIGTSVQAVDGPDAGVSGFRIQMKYSLAEGQPMVLTVGEQDFDMSGALEPSTDSFWITGDAAAALTATFQAGGSARVTGTSRDTAHVVSDTVSAPDMEALAACVAQLPERAPLPPLANQVSMRFTATPDATSIATLEQMRTCGMTPTDRPLHMGRLTRTTGFFAQTDKVFVTFDDAGEVDQVYVPGIFDAGLDGQQEGKARLSRAADGNVPDASNLTKGCLGAEAISICYRPDGDGAHVLQACPDLLPDGTDPAGEPTAAAAPGVTARTALPPGDGPSGPGGGGLFGGGGSGSNEGGNGGGGEPSPVPLPAAGWLLIAALATLAAKGLRRG